MCFSPLLRSAQWHLQLNRGKVNSHRNTRYIWRRSIFVAQESRVTYGADTMCWEVVNESHYSKRFVPRKQNTTTTDPIFQIKPHSGKNTANTVNQLKRSLNNFANDSYVCMVLHMYTTRYNHTTKNINEMTFSGSYIKANGIFCINAKGVAQLDQAELIILVLERSDWCQSERRKHANGSNSAITCKQCMALWRKKSLGRTRGVDRRELQEWGRVATSTRSRRNEQPTVSWRSPTINICSTQTWHTEKVWTQKTRKNAHQQERERALNTIENIMVWKNNGAKTLSLMTWRVMLCENRETKETKDQ